MPGNILDDWGTFWTKQKLAKNHALFISKICLQDAQIDFYVNKFVIKYNK